ncbi:MAG: hypothetical protein DHS20C10_01680 [marine bacterium B5-7]|nr:MAG: hypothetical protein DHS20C10_01680 [marine bacterium B5-7]
MPESTKPVSFIQGLTIGSIAGMTEVMTTGHLLWAMKTRKQQGLPRSFNPRILYRGLWANAASLAPITALQIGFDQALRNRVTVSGETLSPAASYGISFAAGVGSALVSGPAEMVMTVQGLEKKKAAASVRTIVAQAGIRNGLYRGFTAAALRDGNFTAGLLVILPALQAYFSPRIDALQLSSVPDRHQEMVRTALLHSGSGVTAGIFATVVTQSADIVKTVQQSEKLNARNSLTGAIKQVYSSQGWKGFFSGVVSRGTRVTFAVPIMGAVSEHLKAFVR